MSKRPTVYARLTDPAKLVHGRDRLRSHPLPTPALATANDGAGSWLGDLLWPLGTRRRIRPHDGLFSIGDRASHYYLVESGRLLLRRAPQDAAPIVRVVEAGELFIFDCDWIHAADCHALTDAVVLAVDRRRVEIRALFDVALRGVLQAVHAQELAMILQSLGAGSLPRLARQDCVGLPRKAQIHSRGRWQPYLAHGAWSARPIGPAATPTLGAAAGPTDRVRVRRSRSE